MASTPSILGVPLDNEEPPVKKEKTSDELEGSTGAGVLPAVAIKTEPPEYEPGEEPGSPIGSVKSESEYYEEVREPSSPTPAVKIEPPDVMNEDSIHLMDTELPVPEGMEQPGETGVTIKTEPQDPTEGGAPGLSMETGRRSNGEVEKTKRLASPSVPNASAKRRKLKPRASSVQIDTLIALMEERLALAKPCYEFSGGSIREERILWWSQLVERLNALGPATKSRSEWKQFWSGRVRVVREKLAQGAGSAPLTQQDKRIVALLGADTAGAYGGPLLVSGAQSPAEDSSADSRGTAPAGASPWMYEVEHLESLADGQDAEAVPRRSSRGSNRRAAHSGEESGRLLVEYQAQLVAQVARLTEAVLEDTRIRRQQVEVRHQNDKGLDGATLHGVQPQLVPGGLGTVLVQQPQWVPPAGADGAQPANIIYFHKVEQYGVGAQPLVSTQPVVAVQPGAELDQAVILPAQPARPESPATKMARLEAELEALRQTLSLVHRQKQEAEDRERKILSGLSEFLEEDQVRCLEKENVQGTLWSDKTLEKALKIWLSCGSRGYNVVREVGQPLPSERTLQRHLQSRKFPPEKLNTIMDSIGV